MHAEDLGHLLDSLDLGVALVDREGTLLYANRRLASVLEREPAEIVGGTVAGAFPGLSREIDLVHACRTTIERGRTLRLARHEIVPDRQFDVTLTPALPREKARALLSVVEVTDAVVAEAQLLRQTRTRAIANLGNSVAHEIRNPLNSIHMNVQLLREGLAAEELQREALDRAAATVQREIRRLDRVVRDFVQYSRPPALRLEPGSVNKLVRAVLEALDGQVRAKRLQLEIDLRSARPVRMDRDRLMRAIYNVLLNAVQVLPEEGRIRCRTRDEKHRVLVEISDDGPGLDLATNPHIFDLFYTTKPGGTGLGLPIANRIVEEHGGNMAVASEPGHGATFAIFLPYEGPPEEREEGPKAVPIRSEGEGQE